MSSMQTDFPSGEVSTLQVFHSVKEEVNKESPVVAVHPVADTTVNLKCQVNPSTDTMRYFSVVRTSPQPSVVYTGNDNLKGDLE